jgi:ABC-type Fe3+ transport system permease subunit
MRGMNWSLLQNSLLVAALTTVAAVALGGVAALALLALEPRWRKLGLAAAIAALAMPPFVAVNCWLNYLGNAARGATGCPSIHFAGGTAIHALTWLVATLLLLGAWRQLEPAQSKPIQCSPAGAIRALWPLDAAAAGGGARVRARLNTASPPSCRSKSSRGAFSRVQHEL